MVRERTRGMFPKINIRETGINLQQIMDKRGITPKDIKEYLNLTSVQSVYNWCNGLNLPTIDNLYALSQLLKVSVDEILCGNKKMIYPERILIIEKTMDRRFYVYYKMINKISLL